MVAAGETGGYSYQQMGITWSLLYNPEYMRPNNRKPRRNQEVMLACCPLVSAKTLRSNNGPLWTRVSQSDTDA